MKLTVVGCAGSFPNATSPASCYLLEHDGQTIVLDLGNGALGALQQYADIYSLAAVVLSHVHIDHCADVGSLYVARRYRPTGPADSMPVLGPPGVASRIAQLYGLPSVDDLTDDFDFHEYRGSTIQIGPFSITAFPVLHCIPSYGLRVEAGGRTLVYSGDTAPCEALVTASVGADVALYEASYISTNDNPPGIHLTGVEAAQAASEAGVPRLILTHMVTWNDNAAVLAEAVETFGDGVLAAAPGMIIEI